MEDNVNFIDFKSVLDFVVIFRRLLEFVTHRLRTTFLDRRMCNMFIVGMML